MVVVLLYFLAFFAAVISATPSVTVALPLENQLPLIARVGIPFSWTFSPFTFNSSDGPLRYTTSLLPAWLTFDDTSQTFRGTPSAADEGNPEITVTAHASSSSTSSKFAMCVTHYPPPVLSIPIADQFRDNNPSLSSVYLLRPNSAITTSNPALRIPFKWSFSIGYESDTFVSENNLYYELRLANGTDIPDYMVFKDITLDGVIPASERPNQPLVLPFVLHASDKEGYTAATLPFDLVLADHELSHTGSPLPTINITTSNHFSVSLLSSADFTGVLVDGDPIQPSSILNLDIDVSAYSTWLNYDAPSRTLSGDPGLDDTGTNPLLPVMLKTIFNQTIRTNVSLALVPSYFVIPEFPPLHFSKGDQVLFNLGQWFSDSAGRDEANITVACSPSNAANWLRFDASSTNLTGIIPSDWDAEEDHVTVTFTAYSHKTHSTSHAGLALYIADTGHNKSLAPKNLTGLSTAAHRRLVLALAITFGLMGGICLIGGLLAGIRRCVRVEDTAVLGEEGRHAWSEKDRRWYGMTLSPRGTRVVEKDLSSASSPSLLPPQGYPRSNYGNLGLGLRRVSERSQGDQPSPRVMRKGEFISKIKETVRHVSDKYTRRQRGPSNPRPFIGRPILIAPVKSNGQTEPQIHVSPSNPFGDLPSRPGSTFMSGSPSNSTTEHSIPRRRPDFAPPRNLAQVHFDDARISRQLSTGSFGGSLRSGRSGLSRDSSAEASMGPPTRPRLVPFTSSTRVPMPQALVVANHQDIHFNGNRITSQRVKVCKIDSQNEELVVEGAVKPSGSSDELTMGIHYVRSLGADQLAVNGGAGVGSSPALSNLRSSFTSLESSHVGHKSGSMAEAMKVLVRIGEKFKFRVPVSSTASLGQNQGFQVRLISGQPLPKFLQADLSGISSKGMLEVSGTANFRDIGETAVGVYAVKDGLCMANIIIEVVGKR
ncbi:hypothetical protein B0H34DRAFT_796883 [Crassisporium funariophilum]|nr:hypothetical protein B0H34DRAFT_796883 [Crassisporium funariophilum]